jgi:hypothetical protein
MLLNDDHPGDHPTNGEESYYEDSNGKLNIIANYNKGLPHHFAGQEVGEVNPNDYRKLLKAARTGKQSDFNAIPRGTTDACGRKFVNPQAGLAFDLEGADSHALVTKKDPRIREPEAASEMAELYWMAYCRDVGFNKFDTDPDIGHQTTFRLNMFYKVIIDCMSALTVQFSLDINV